MKFLGFGKKKNGAKKRKAVLDKTTLVPNASIPEPAVADNSPERVSENVPDESGGLTKVHSKEFGTPVVAGSGDLPTTPATEAETPSPVLASLNVVSQRDEESLEIVIQGIVTDQPLVDESPLAVEVTPSEDVPDYQEEEEEEEPFDQAEFRGPEDPTILDFEKAASKELHAIKDDDDEPPPPPPPLPEALARRLLGAFNCESSTTMDASRRIMESFYDTMCGTELHKRSSKRPYFNREFTLTFIKELTQDGLPLLYHLANTSKEEVWTGRSVTMYIRLGNSHATQLVQPRLTWTSMGGGNAEPVTVEVDLLDIQNVLDSADRDDVRDDGEIADMCFFSVTTIKGDVYLFETSSYEERDRVVNGIKNVIARLSFHLVAGDAAITSELYSEDSGQMSGELPSLRTQAQAMNQISNAFLDIGLT